MNLHDWELEIWNMRQRIAFLQRQSEQAQVADDLQFITTIFEELHQALEELQIAQEDLQQQNQELSNARQVLLIQNRRYQELFEEAPDAYLVTNMQGVVQEANRAANNLLNISNGFLIGEPLDIYIAEEEQVNFHYQLRNLYSSVDIQEWEVNICPRNRTPIIAAVRVAVIRHQPDQSVGLRWLLRDTTTTKQTQAKLQRAEEATRQALLQEKKLSELKSHLLATTSHEFRNPLATIHSSAELLEHYRHKWSDERQVAHFRRIQKSVMHMTQLLNDLLIMSQDEAEKSEFKPASLNLIEFCRELLAELQQDDRSHHAIAFQTNYQCIEADFDPKLLHQILNNLILNAMKYSPHGSTIRFSVNYIHNQAILQIQDFGIGIPPADIEHIFEPFHRGSNVANIPGMGLGMSIVKKALSLHGGEITVESLVNRQTTFTITLPLTEDLRILLVS